MADLGTLAKLAGRQDRAAAGHGRDPTSGRHRQPHGAVEPALIRAAGLARPAATTKCWPWPWPTSTTSRRSTTPTATRPAIGRCGSSPRCSPSRYAPRTWCAATAARSSSSRCPAAPATRPGRSSTPCAARLDAAITVAGLPKFTVSFGVVDAGNQEDLPSLVSRADAALFQAKRDGRDRVVVHDAAGQLAAGKTNLRASSAAISPIQATPHEAAGLREAPRLRDAAGLTEGPGSETIILP